MKRQNGAALLIALMVVVLTITAGLLSAYNNRNSQVERDKITDAALAQAKAALIAWSAAHPSFPGSLPCPEDANLIGYPTEGKALLSCSNLSVQVGRLPWRDLGLDNPRDATGEQLWYVLSPGFRQPPINSESTGQLIIDTDTTGAIALIIAPGPAISGQIRPIPTATSHPDVTQYLDGTNNDLDTIFTATPVTGIVNDRILAIYPSDLMKSVEKRVANEVKYALREYYCGASNVKVDGSCDGTPEHGFYPRPAAFSDANCLGTSATCESAISGNEGRIPASISPSSIDWSSLSLLRGMTGSPPDWFQKNRWRELVYYAVAPACIEGTTNCGGGGGYLTVKHPGASSATNIQVVIAVAGRYLGSTTRSNAVITDYLEDENASSGDNIFSQWPATVGTPFNDHIVTIP